MKLLRIGMKNHEKPAALDVDGKIRDLSSHIKDLNKENLNFQVLSKLQNTDLSSLPEIPSSERIGSCVSNPGKFVAIGLNFSDHAAETGAPCTSDPANIEIVNSGPSGIASSTTSSICSTSVATMY